MLGYLGSFFGYFFEKPMTHIFHNFSVDLGTPDVWCEHTLSKVSVSHFCSNYFRAEISRSLV